MILMWSANVRRVSECVTLYTRLVVVVHLAIPARGIHMSIAEVLATFTSAWVAFTAAVLRAP